MPALNFNTLHESIGKNTSRTTRGQAWHTLRHRCLALIIPTIFILLMNNKICTAAELQRALEPVVRYFEDQQLIPIIIPRSQQLGNVYDLESKRFLHAQKECFPNLRYETLPSSLPPFIANSNSSGLLSLGISPFGESTLKAESERVVSIEYTDVKVQLVPEAEFRRKYDAEACPELNTMLQGGASSWFQRTTLVIGELYLGRKLLTLDLNQDIDVAAKVKILTAALLARGAAVEVAVDASEKGRSRLLIKSSTVVPLAFRPAFLAHAIVGVSMGATPSAGPVDGMVKWEPYEGRLPSHRSAIEALDEDLLRLASPENLP